MKFTDEQLSRILGEHEAGTLQRYGGYDWGVTYGDLRCCINQVANNEAGVVAAFRYNEDAAGWFDENYEPTWTAGRFLFEMEKAGLA